jgi:hypothetical protein
MFDRHRFLPGSVRLRLTARPRGARACAAAGSGISSGISGAQGVPLMWPPPSTKSVLPVT